jgi:hypothetical protein
MAQEAQEKQAKSIFIYSNGTFSIRDQEGNQIGMEKGWMTLLFDYLESEGIKPLEVESIECVINGEIKIVFPCKDNSGWNWSYMPSLEKKIIM